MLCILKVFFMFDLVITFTFFLLRIETETLLVLSRLRRSNEKEYMSEVTKETGKP